jgi:hypothetical protein
MELAIRERRAITENAQKKAIWIEKGRRGDLSKHLNKICGD